MEYIPKSKSHAPDACVIGLFVLAVVLFGVSNLLTGTLHVVPQFAALFALTGAVYIGIRYRFTEFRYVLSEDDDGGILLTVYRATGRRSIAEARMSGAYLEEVTRYTDSRSLKEAKRDKAVYVYTASMKPDAPFVCVFGGDPRRKTALILEGEGEFFDYLSRIAEENRRRGEITDIDE